MKRDYQYYMFKNIIIIMYFHILPSFCGEYWQCYNTTWVYQVYSAMGSVLFKAPPVCSGEGKQWSSEMSGQNTKTSALKMILDEK